MGQTTIPEKLTPEIVTLSVGLSVSEGSASPLDVQEASITEVKYDPGDKKTTIRFRITYKIHVTTAKAKIESTISLQIPGDERIEAIVWEV